jgi:hypothetical protein
MELIIRLSTQYAVPIASRFEIRDGVETEVLQYSWEGALRAAALEVQALNAYAGTKEFPFPIACNPGAMILNTETGVWEGQIEGFLGQCNTPPTPDRGMVTVSLLEYEWIETALLPAMPTTFCIIVGDPPVGKII